MKLEEFISETIKQVIDGVITAQEYVKSKGGSISPTTMTTTTSNSPYYDRKSGQIANNIEFDIAITTTEQGETKAGAGIFVSVFKAGIQDKSTLGSISENRIKFSIPIFLPQQKT